MTQAGASRYRLFLLGGFELQVDGRPVVDASWPRRKPKAVVKLLALQPARAAHREQVIEALWPDAEPRAAANNLKQTLHVLRGAFDGECPVEVRDAHLALSQDMWLDVDAFRSAAHKALAARDLAQCEEALALYRGELLPMDRYEPWAEGPRNESDRLRRSVLRLSAELFAAVGDALTAEDRLRRLVALDTTDEDARLRLIRLLDESGAPRRALAQYRALETALRNELDVEPSPEADALLRSIRERVESGSADAPHPPLDVRHARSADGTRIAYVVHTGGRGTPLLYMPTLPWSHLQVEWDIPEWREWVLRLAQRRTVVRYDLRGLGLSASNVSDLSVDRLVEDVEAVVRDGGLCQFDLLVMEGAGVPAITYAARHPGRVRRAVFYSAWANGPAFAAEFERMGLRQMVHDQWEMYTSVMARGSTGDAGRFADRITGWIRTPTREMYERYFDAVTAVDATPLLTQIRAPALIAWRRSTLSAFGPSLAMAPHLHDVRVVEVEGTEYAPMAGDIEPLASAIDDFLGADLGGVALAR
jgi:DNA-binding SARP family transcriptional activator/pimeloyl-ACP methyl ester carboxylesterase